MLYYNYLLASINNDIIIITAIIINAMMVITCERFNIANIIVRANMINAILRYNFMCLFYKMYHNK